MWSNLLNFLYSTGDGILHSYIMIGKNLHFVSARWSYIDLWVAQFFVFTSKKHILQLRVFFKDTYFINLVYVFFSYNEKTCSIEIGMMNSKQKLFFPSKMILVWQNSANYLFNILHWKCNLLLVHKYPLLFLHF